MELGGKITEVGFPPCHIIPQVPDVHMTSQRMLILITWVRCCLPSLSTVKLSFFPFPALLFVSKSLSPAHAHREGIHLLSEVFRKLLIFFKIIFIYLFLAALGLRCSVRASHCGGFSCCGARALGTRAYVVVARGH